MEHKKARKPFHSKEYQAFARADTNRKREQKDENVDNLCPNKVTEDLDELVEARQASSSAHSNSSGRDPLSSQKKRKMVELTMRKNHPFPTIEVHVQVEKNLHD